MSGGFDTSPVDHPGLFVAGGETAAPAEFLSLLRASLQVGKTLASVQVQVTRAVCVSGVSAIGAPSARAFP